MEMLKGESAYLWQVSQSGYEVAILQSDSQANRWSSTENNSSNAWNVNFGSGQFNNNNNKNNAFGVRPVVAYDTPLDFQNLVNAAFRDCCKGKRNSTACIDYCQIANDDLPALAHELYTGTYRPGVSTCFLVKYPKYREVFAACFRDRIVHHLLFLQLNPLFEQRFVAQGNVSFNCRKGFGTRAAQMHAFECIRKATDNYRRKAWVYRGDIVSFFMSIDKRILWNKLEAFIKRNYSDPYLKVILTVTRIVVFSLPGEEVRIQFARRGMG